MAFLPAGKMIRINATKNPFAGFGGEMNDPMNTDLILEIIFSFCPVDTLKSCRLVSKQWKDVSLRAWRHKAVLSPGRKCSKGLQNIQKYLKLLQSNSKKDEALQLNTYPFKNFRIQSSLSEYLKESANPISNTARHVILRDYNRQLIQIREFLSKFQLLHFFELENCEWKRLPSGPVQSSNVKRLRIYRDVNHSEFTEFGFEDWIAFMKCFQSLEAISIEYRTPKAKVTDYMSCEIQDFMLAIHEIRTGSKAMTIMALKELEVIHIPQNNSQGVTSSSLEDIVSAIIDCQFPLEKLTIHLLRGISDLIDEQKRHSFHRLLNCYKDTLQYLKTSFILDDEVSEKELRAHILRPSPKEAFRMDALKELHLSNGLLGLIMIADIELPNLQKLRISNEESTLKTMDFTTKQQQQLLLPFPRGRVYEKLETLEILDNRQIPGPKTIGAFGMMMPNLVNLTIPLDKKTFEIVCENLRGLKTLNVLAAQCRYDELDDESLTGISKGKDPQGPRKPNITDLVHLTNNKIACETELQGNAQFTDHSVVHGFLQLPDLYFLCISFKEISDENMIKLLKHVRGYMEILVIDGPMPDSYCGIEVDCPGELEEKIQLFHAQQLKS